jgi:hypothetical protein
MIVVDSTVLASYHGHLEVVQALLGAEADVNKADSMVIGLHCTGPPRMGTWRWCRLCWARRQM